MGNDRDLIDRFIGFTKSHNLFAADDRIVVGLSGGGDSLALVDLFSRTGQPVFIAHCNFKLREEESDQDEEFVRKIAVVYDIPLQTKEFDTRAYARQQGISVEMAARDLRYDWFEQIRRDTASAWIAVAHHADDSIETMLINLIRGTGIRGLAGIQPRQGNLIRPMLFATRVEIHDYLDFRGLEYRNDTSNRDIRLIRNRIRHIILPELEKINPAVRQIFREEQLVFQQARKIIENFTEQKISKLTVCEQDRIKINISQLMDESFRETILFDLLMPYGFHSRQIRQILAATNSIPGKIFRSRTHSLLIDREQIIITPVYEKIPERYYFDPEFPDDDLPLNMQYRILSPDDYVQPSDPGTACLDYQKLDFPLILRKWETGDYFYPLGMDHSKKVSDFFIDRKVNRFDKNLTWILASGEQIVWIIGHRIDQRFRVTDETEEVLEIRVVY